MSRWFRLYDDLVDDPKVQRLPADTFRGLINLWCLASQNDGVLPLHADIAFKLRLTDQKATKLLDDLVTAGLLEHDETGVRPHNWDKRQHKHDSSNDRVKRFRERQRNAGVTVTATAPETEADTDTKATALVAAEKPKPEKRKYRMPPDWQPSDEARANAIEELGSAELADREIIRCRNHFVDKGEPRAGWDRTFINWAMKAAEDGKRNRSNGRRFAASHQPGKSGVDAVHASVDRYLADRGLSDPGWEQGRLDARADDPGVIDADWTATCRH